MAEKLKRSTLEAYAGIVLAAIVGVFPMNWWIKLILTFILGLIATDIAFHHPKTLRAHWMVRLCLAVVGIVIVTLVGYFPIHKQYMEDHASALEGQLCTSRSFWGTCYTPPLAIIEIGNSGTTIIYAGNPNALDMGTFARNVGFHIELGKHGIELTTPLLDRVGRKILTIEKNHWTVIPQPGIWDKNYTDNALEVKDSRGEVVFQVKYLTDRIQISAEWRDQFGHGQEWVRCKRGVAGGCISQWGNLDTERQNEIPIEPIFRYPSSEYWGKFVTIN